MAAKKGNGLDPATQAIVNVLLRIEKQVETTNDRLDALRQEVHEFRTETREELVDIRGELHQARESLETRVAKLEAAVFRPTGT